MIYFNSINPINIAVPKLVYEDTMRFSESLPARNKRLLNLFTVQKMRESTYLSSLALLNLSWGELEVCFTEDQLFTVLLLAHWLKRNNYSRNFSTKQSIYLGDQLEKIDTRFSFDKQEGFIKEWNELIIPSAMAPTIHLNVNSPAYDNDAKLLSDNKFQRYIF